MEGREDGEWLMKWVGAVFIILGCGGIGFLMVASHRREETVLQELIFALQHMNSELQYQMTPLPQLCHHAAERCNGYIRLVFEQLSTELDNQILPDASACMYAAVSKFNNLPDKANYYLMRLGTSLGCFDLPGQIKGMEAVEKDALQALSALRENKEMRCRNYQTFALCAGLALVVLFI